MSKGSSSALAEKSHGQLAVCSSAGDGVVVCMWDGMVVCMCCAYGDGVVMCMW